MKFSIKHFFSKCEQICTKLQIQSHLLKKALMKNFIFYPVKYELPRLLHRHFTSCLHLFNWRAFKQIYQLTEKLISFFINFTHHKIKIKQVNIQGVVFIISWFTCLVSSCTLIPLVLLVQSLAVLVRSLVILICRFVFFACPLVISVCPLVVLAVISTGLLITDVTSSY